MAEKSDVVLFIGGLTPEWESEGFDRANLDLPGRQDEVISRLAKVNPNTVVCIQAVSFVSCCLLYILIWFILGVRCGHAMGKRG